MFENKSKMDKLNKIKSRLKAFIEIIENKIEEWIQNRLQALFESSSSYQFIKKLYLSTL